MPTKILEDCSHREITLRLLYLTEVPNIFFRSYCFSTDIFSLHKVKFPYKSPEMIPPFYLSQSADTALLCSLNIFVQELPFHKVRSPFCIDTIQSLFLSTAMDRQGKHGALPKIPFLHSSFPFEK